MIAVERDSDLGFVSSEKAKIGLRTGGTIQMIPFTD